MGVALFPAGGRKRYRPRELEQDFGAARAIVGRLELIGAGRAARRPALDAAQLVEGEPKLSPATASRIHEQPPWPRMSGKRGKKRSNGRSARNYLIIIYTYFWMKVLYETQ